MSVSKIMVLIMTAATIVAFLALIFSAIIWISYPNVKVEDGSVVLPDPITDFQSTPSLSADIAPEGLTFKGTFKWEEKDGARSEDNSICYLWIHTTDDGTIAKFSYGEHLIHGWPVFLAEQTGGHYVFKSAGPDRNYVEEVKITVDVTDTGMSGTVENTTIEISNFVRGSFTGESISYELYAAEVLD
ncbi:hypothetical protein ACFL2D_01535 [Patescibacteria group bacterium]